MPDTPDQAPSRVDRRKTRTRRHLLEAAISLLLEKDYEDLTTDEITEHADVGRRTFYNHFVNKRDCIVEAVKGRFIHYAAESEKALEAAPDPDEALAVAAMACRVFQDIALDPVTKRLLLHPKVLSEAIAESQRDYISANLARGLATNRLRPGVPVESLEPILAWGFVGLVIASIERSSQREDGLVWAGFVLHNFGLEEDEVQGLIARITR